MSRLESRNFKVSSRLGLEAMMSRLGRFGPRSSSGTQVQILCEEFDSRLEPIAFDIYIEWLLIRTAQAHLAVSSPFNTSELF